MTLAAVRTFVPFGSTGWKLDQLVYQLYNLIDTEMRIVEEAASVLIGLVRRGDLNFI
jgi:hypothetical protein